jgi:protein involved in polysaccharide export with SLBB domain
VKDKAREQAAQVIATATRPFYLRLSMTVGVDKYTSNLILLLGAVEHPGPVTFDAPPTLLEVLTMVSVPSPSEQYVSVLGQVNHPGAMMLETNTTLSKLLAQAGGLTQLVGRDQGIQVIFQAIEQSRTIRFKQLLTTASMDLTLKSRDVVYVTESGLSAATDTHERLAPFISISTKAARLNRQ